MTNALLVTNPTNIRFLTGFVGLTAQTGVEPAEREAYCLSTKDKTYLFTSSLYLESARKLKNVDVRKISLENPISSALSQLVEELSIKKLGFEERDLTVAEFNKFKKAFVGVELVPTKNKIEEMRMIKKTGEIETIRRAASITDQCFKFIIKRIRPGVTESRLANEIEGFFKYKGDEIAFSPIVAFNEHSSQPHYQSKGKDPLRRGSLILLDFGAKVNGYCSDMTRVVFLGKPKPEWVKTYDTVLRAQEKALDLLGSGERHGATLDAAAKEYIAEADSPPYEHSLGHNVGLAIHEGPRLSVKKNEMLKPGMVFSVEPGIYIEGQYGIRIEDLVLLTNTGIEILSRSPKEMMIL